MRSGIEERIVCRHGKQCRAVALAATCWAALSCTYVFAAPTFSMRIERFDSQVCSYGYQTPGSVVHIFPSIVLPCVML